MANILRELALSIPNAFIMRIVEPDIEVFVASHSDGNPYHPGEREKLWGSDVQRSFIQSFIRINK